MGAIVKVKKLVYIDVTGGKRVQKTKTFESTAGLRDLDQQIEDFRYSIGCDIVEIQYDESWAYYDENREPGE